MKILALIPRSNEKSPARIYRGDGVLEKLNGVTVDYFNFDIHPNDWQKQMRIAKEYKAVYVMRSAHQEDAAFCSKLRLFGTKIWWDLDDDYTSIEPDSVAYEAFQQETTKSAWMWFLENADIRTYSTKYLAEKFGNGYLIPNAIDDEVFPLNREYPSPNPGLITWRGGGTHFQDLQLFTPQIDQFLQTNPNWNMNFMGFSPWWLTKHKNASIFRYVQDYWYYMLTLQDLKPWAHLVPLRPCNFNLGKSNIAALESVVAGAVPIVPDWPEWQLPAALKYKTPEEMAQRMAEATKMSPEEHKDRWNANIAWVKEKASLTEVNKKRLELLK